MGYENIFYFNKLRRSEVRSLVYKVYINVDFFTCVLRTNINIRKRQQLICIISKIFPSAIGVNPPDPAAWVDNVSWIMIFCISHCISKIRIHLSRYDAIFIGFGRLIIMTFVGWTTVGTLRSIDFTSTSS